MTVYPQNDSRRPNVLLVAHRFPYPPDKGDRIRTYHLLRFLARHAAVHLACLADEPVEPSALAALGDLCARVAAVPVGRRSRWGRALASFARGRTVTEGAFRSAALEAVLDGWARETRFAGAIASSSGVAPFLRIPALASVPAVVDLVDVDSQKWLDYAAAASGPRSWLYRAEGRRLRSVERSILGWARAVTLVSEAEAALFRSAVPGSGEVCVATNGVDLDYFRPAPGPEEGCVFVGALDYRPNVDAACWFCSEVWPAVRQRHPSARMSLVGRRPASAVRRLARLPGVDVVGQVPDVRPFVRRAAVAVAPLRIARGLQNKVLEAMAMGKAAVASPQALAGVRGPEGLPVVEAGRTAEWVEALDRLLADRDERAARGAEGRRYAEAHHDWSHCLDPFAGLLGLAAARTANAAHVPAGC